MCPLSRTNSQEASGPESGMSKQDSAEARPCKSLKFTLTISILYPKAPYYSVLLSEGQGSSECALSLRQ